MGRPVARQFVGNEAKRFVSLPLQELSEESSRCTPVPTGLNENIDHVTVLIHGAPEILALPVDRDEDFVQVPCVAETALTAFQSAGVLCSEFDRPLSDRFIRNVHATLSE